MSWLLKKSMGSLKVLMGQNMLISVCLMILLYLQIMGVVYLGGTNTQHWLVFWEQQVPNTVLQVKETLYIYVNLWMRDILHFMSVQKLKIFFQIN